VVKPSFPWTPPIKMRVGPLSLKIFFENMINFLNL
jgi:hypothetical protein